MIDEIAGLTIFVILFVLVLVLLFMQRIQAGRQFGLRSLPFVQHIRQQISLSAERGGLLNLTLGRAGLTGASGPVSVTALILQEQLTDESNRFDVPSVVSSGDGTLFIASRSGGGMPPMRGSGHPGGNMERALFLAPAENPMSYGAGVTWLLNEEHTANSVAVGRLGSEIGLIAETALRGKIQNFAGVDDPTAMAIANATTDNVLLGEELFAAPTYFSLTLARLASLRAQDVLRWLIAIALLIIVALRLLGVIS
jgi:hypothetical protein